MALRALPRPIPHPYPAKPARGRPPTLRGVPAYVCLLEIQISLPHVTSLKEKRRIVKSLTSQVRQRFGAAISEVADHDVRGHAILLSALVGGRDTVKRADELARFVEARCPDGCTFERDLRTLADIRG